MANGKDKSEKAEATGRSAFSVPDLVTAAAIVIEESGEAGASIEDIHEEIIRKYPTYDPEAVKSTIIKIVPERITREVFTVDKTAEGRFKKAE
jgi:hypothetical protein